MGRRKDRRTGGFILGVAIALAAFGAPAAAVAQTTGAPPTTPARGTGAPLTAGAQTAGAVPLLVPITIPIYDVDSPVGTISAKVSPTGDFLIPVASLLPVLQTLYDDDSFALVAARLQGRGEIGPEDVAALRLPIRFDPQRVALILEVPADVRGRTVLELGASGRAPDPTRSRRPPDDFSGYLNVNFGLIDDPTISNSRTRALFLTEGALRFGGFVLENSATLEFGGVEGQTLSRQATRLTYDIPDAGIRLSAGDIFTPSIGFVGSTDILGISAFRNVDVFDPFQTSRPVGRQAFQLSVPSDVDIFVNGALVRQQRLQPGSYDLTNFPQIEGANDIRIEVRNDLGQTQTFSFSSFYDADLLAPGIDQWEFDAGVLATRFNRQVQYDFDAVAAQGFYRRGITNELTLGVNGQYYDGRGIVGAEGVVATAFANISFDLAASFADGRMGQAVAVTFQPFLSSGWQASGRTLDGFVEYASRDFGDNAVTGFGRGFRFGVRYNDIFANDRLSFSATAAYSEVYESSRDGWDLSVSLAYRFDDDFILRVTPAYREANVDEANASIRVSLTKRFGRTSRANASYDTRRNRYLAEYEYRSQYGGIGTIGANVTMSGADNQEQVGDASVNYIGNRFEASAGYSHVFSDGRGDELGRSRVNVATALAFSGGDFAIGRPIQDSFAIVRAHPTLDDRQVIVGPAVSGQGDRARTGALGPALLPDLGAYSLSRVLFDVRDLPPGYDLGTGAFEFFPPYHSGYSVTVGSNRLASALGTISGTDGQPLAFAVGTVTSTSDEEFEPQQVFTNRSGRFGITGLVPGNSYELAFPNQGVRARIEVPADATGFVDVGAIVGRGNE